MAISGAVYWFYDLNVQKSGANLPDASVFAFDADGTKVTDVTTDAGGNIVTQRLQELVRDINGGSTQTLKTPHNIGILKWLHVPFAFPKTVVQSAREQFPLTQANNNYITETTQATVDAYTGSTTNDGTETVTLDGTGVTPIDRTARLYDFYQSRAIGTPLDQPFLTGIASPSADGNVFPFLYDLVIDGFTFDGQGKTINIASGKDLTIQGVGGNISDVTIGGDVLLNTEANLNNVTINGDLRINTGANSTLSFTNVTVTGQVFNDAAANTLTINATGSSLTAGDPGTGVGQTNILQSVPVTVTATFGGVPVEGAPVYLKTTPASGGIEVLNGVTNASGVLSGTFAGSTPAEIDTDVSGVKSSSGPIPYTYFELGGTIEAIVGYSATALLTED